MKYITRQDFPDQLPPVKTQYCWYCRAPGAVRSGKKRIIYKCSVCGRSSGRVLIYDPNMQMHFDNENRLVHESCGVIITRDDGNILMFQRTKFPHKLTIPAGHMEVGEDPLPCAIRETKEEVGITQEKLTKLFDGDIEGDSCLGGADIHHWHAFAGKVDETVAISLDGEGSSWGWYKIEQLTSDNTVHPVIHLLKIPEVVKKLKSLNGSKWTPLGTLL